MTDFNEELGLRLAVDGATVTLETRPEHEIGGGWIHFAVLATLAEVSAARAVDERVVPASLTLNLLSPAKRGTLVARGRVLRKGRRLAVAEGEVLQDEKLIAKAVVTFSIA